MLNHLKRFLKNESGAAAIEYGLIAAAVAVVIIPTVHNVGQKLVEVLTKIEDAF